LAQVIQAQDDHVRAKQLHNETYEGRLRTLGLTHPDTLTSAGSLADILDSIGEEQKAKDLRSEVILQGLLGSTEEELALQASKETDIASHMQLDCDEDGQPTGLRFVYVSEPECVGCTFCADVAENTFFMEPDAGRARAFAQGTDDPDLIQEAIDCCPVNCIWYVDLEDLVILETERVGLSINPGSMGLRGVADPAVGAGTPTKAKLGGSGSNIMCNNCPTKGCRECPMYGVGLNPVYLERMKAQEEKRIKSGQAAREAAEAEAQLVIKDIMSGYDDDDESNDAEPSAVTEAITEPVTTELSVDLMKSIFDDFEDESTPAPAPSDSGDALPSREELAALFAASTNAAASDASAMADEDSSYYLSQPIAPTTIKEGFTVGDDVDAYDEADGLWYPGSIREVKPDGTYLIKWEGKYSAYPDEVKSSDEIRPRD
jgi:ferredoxin